MLTKKQYELLVFIDRRLKDQGVSPSFDEMKEALGLKSKSGIHRLISGLEERGFIRRLPHRARALEVLKLPENSSQSTQPPSNVITGSFGQPAALDDGANDVKDDPSGPEGGDGIDLPLYGRIAAGTPIAALQDPSMHIQVPPSMLGTGTHYALEVDGDSMIEAGIFDGDTVIIEEGSTAENGSIVVALVDNEEATLKRIRKKGSAIALEPANKAYETRIFGPDRVKVQGRLVALLRQY